MIRVIQLIVKTTLSFVPHTLYIYIYIYIYDVSIYMLVRHIIEIYIYIYIYMYKLCELGHIIANIFAIHLFTGYPLSIQYFPGTIV